MVEFLDLGISETFGSRFALLEFPLNLKSKSLEEPVLSDAHDPPAHSVLAQNNQLVGRTFLMQFLSSCSISPSMIL